MLELLFVIAMLTRQYWFPILAVVGSVWSFNHFGDANLIPKSQVGQKVQQVFYQVKYQPFVRDVVNMIDSTGFGQDVTSFSRNLQVTSGLDRSNALMALKLLGPDASNAIPTLIWTLYDQQPEVRNAALLALRAVATPQGLNAVSNDAMPLLIGLMRHPDNEVQHVVGDMLRLMKTPEAEQLLRTAMKP